MSVHQKIGLVVVCLGLVATSARAGDVILTDTLQLNDWSERQANANNWDGQGDVPQGKGTKLSLGFSYFSEYFKRGRQVTDNGFIGLGTLDVRHDLFTYGSEDQDLARIRISTEHLIGTGDPGSGSPFNNDALIFSNISAGAWSSHSCDYLPGRIDNEYGIRRTILTDSNLGEDVTSLYFRMVYNDGVVPGEGTFGDIALYPHIELDWEVSGAHDDWESGLYIEAGVRPTYETELAGQPVRIGVPITAGFGAGGYYERQYFDGVGTAREDDTFGFVQVGAFVDTYVAPFGDRSPVQLHTGVHGLFLGSANTQQNDGDEFELIFVVGATLHLDSGDR